MSDQWVGPGWWMASDGKWYPPRTSSATDAPDSGDEPSAVSAEEAARLGTPKAGDRSSPAARVASTPQSRAEQAASRAQRAASLPKPAVVSVGRPKDEVSVGRAKDEVVPAHEESADEESPDEATIDTEVIDLRDGVVAAALGGVGDSEVIGDTQEAATDAAFSERSPNASRSLEFAASARGDAGGRAAPASESSFSTGGSTNGSIWTRSDADHTEMDTAGEHGEDTAVPPPVEPAPAPLQHAVLPQVAGDDEVRSSPRGARTLLVVATGLAVLSGVLGALWLRERSAADDLRSEMALSTVEEDVTSADVTELTDEVNTLRLQNEQLRSQLSDMSALVLELPEGRVTEIAVPFTPVFADEENGRFIAVGDGGEYVVWADGADAEITDSGTLGGSPTGVFAATAKAWIATDQGTIEIVSLNNTEGLPSVEFGPSDFMAAEERAYWTYERDGGNVVRLRKSDGGVTASVSVPVPVVDLTIGAGSVWALGDDGRVYRINTADFTVQAIDGGADLISITAGPDALWTLSAADGSLRRVDPVSGEVLVTVPVGRDPIDATFAGSSVWVALRSGTSLIEVDTRTAAVISRTALPGTPTALHQGDSGVFVTLEGDVPLVRVASQTQAVEDADGDDAVDAG